jgi:5-methyltetrahydrofolate--homocysteine methyltransferase
MIRKCAEQAKNTDIIVTVPDIVENIDIISAMRGPHQCCYDLYYYPNKKKKALSQITDLYDIYYGMIYDIIKKPDGSSAYGPYNVYGSGKSAKIQCDFNALISPEHFDEFIMPCLRRQCDGLDNIVFHLDGVECIAHVDSLLSLDRLGAIQWTPPPGPSDIKAANDRWFDLYKKVRRGGKGLWLSLAEYGPEGSIEAADKIIKEIGPEGLYLQFPEMDKKLAESLMLHAEKNWKS